MPFWFLILLSGILYISARLIDFENIDWYRLIFKTTRNGLFVILPYMVLGGMLSKIVYRKDVFRGDSRNCQGNLVFRFLSVHIYLTHMLFVGLFYIFTDLSRGVVLWASAVVLSGLSGAGLVFLPKVQKLLYGRVYCSYETQLAN